MRKLLFLLFIGIAISLTSCRKDFAFEQSSGGLEFSKNTVYLDTVFTNIGSSTYSLKVYNRSNKDIAIPKIQLGKGINSKYRIMVDGMTGDAGAQGKIFSNVELLAKDSLFIFIEVTSDVASANPTDFLYTDQIQFSNVTGAPQTVDLVTLIQDAYFIYPQRTLNVDNSYSYEGINLGLGDDNQPINVIGSNLDHSDPINGDEFHWKNDKPYVVYGYALVPNNETLNVDAGARVHFHANSGLIIAKNGVLKINGEAPTDHKPENLTKEVIFEGDRLEPNFSDVTGQWTAIINYSTSPLNEIKHLTLKNATVGILSQNLALTSNTTDFPRMNIKDSQIYNCSNFGILARKSIVTGENLVINTCGQADFAGTFGGTYNFTHCTFNNNWNSSKQVAVLLNNYIDTDTTRYVSDLTAANFTNCIVYGSNQNELYLDNEKQGATAFNYNFTNCLIKFNNINNNINYLPTNTTNFHDCYAANNSSVFNPQFKNLTKNQLQPQTVNSGVYKKGTPIIIVPNDVLGNARSSPTDLGAYNVAP